MAEGIFDQTIVGETAAFSGATPSALSPNWKIRVATEADKLLQVMGAEDIDPQPR